MHAGPISIAGGGRVGQALGRLLHERGEPVAGGGVPHEGTCPRSGGIYRSQRGGGILLRATLAGVAYFDPGSG